MHTHQIVKGKHTEKHRETTSGLFDSNNKDYNRRAGNRPNTDIHTLAHTVEPLPEALGLYSKQRQPYEKPVENNDRGGESSVPSPATLHPQQTQSLFQPFPHSFIVQGGKDATI